MSVEPSLAESCQPVATLEPLPPDPAALVSAGEGTLAAHRAQAALLRRNSIWMLAANVVYSGCQWANLAVLARIGTEAMVGQFVLALAVTAPVAALLMLQLRNVQATDAARHYRFGDYLGLRLITTFLALGVVVLVCVVRGYHGDDAWAIIALGLSSAIDGLSDVVYGLLQQRERLDRMAQSLIGKGLLSLLAMTAVVGLTGRVFWGVLAMAAVRLLVLLGWDLRQGAVALGDLRHASPRAAAGESLWPRWDFQRLRSLALLALPLGIVMGLVVLNIQIPRYFVEGQADLGKSALGILGAVGYMSVVGTILVGALGESAVPRLARCYRQGSRGAFGQLVLGLLAAGAVLGVAGVGVSLLAGPQLLRLLYGRAYAQHGALLVWLMVAGGVSYVVSFAGYAITSARYFRIQIPLFALTTATTCLACWWLVPRCGLLGAAYGLTASALVQLLLTGIVLAHALRAQTPVVPHPEVV